ncbi:unnamed protein product [Nesidiocoris tenuis]|uniref:Uncharacterized protein n=1 Tax=Nesidiocoris tenuis TaxID=355587 RepID=A0A6H5HD18_9HEMI|nr:unnamed protein product [Nesidiocoris tenuis]
MKWTLLDWQGLPALQNTWRSSYDWSGVSRNPIVRNLHLSTSRSLIGSERMSKGKPCKDEAEAVSLDSSVHFLVEPTVSEVCRSEHRITSGLGETGRLGKLGLNGWKLIDSESQGAAQQRHLLRFLAGKQSL